MLLDNFNKWRLYIGMDNQMLAKSCSRYLPTLSEALEAEYWMSRLYQMH